ncbi:MAG: glycosyltransferase family 39 protein [Anaerolineaceae bacterium]|nr:glycosyltransferase family 39 protein [Anaerolineaceae bacterium]
MPLLILLPLIGFFLLWMLLLSLNDDDKETKFLWQDTLIKASLYWFVYFAVGTELLSLIKGLTTLGVALLWTPAVVVLLVITLKRKSVSKGWAKVIKLIRLPKNFFGIAALIVIVGIVVILLITGIMSPPNIHDVLTYHMTRVMHWIQNQSVAYFPTSITFQLWHPPFAEYNLLHWTLLSGNTYLSSFHQWYGLILTLIVLGATTGRLGAKSRGQWIAALFYVTLPIVVLQASGTKNDVFLGYLLATLCYFVVKASKTGLDRSDWFGASISVGLGLLTKGSYAFYALPLLAWLLVVVIKKAGVKQAVQFA